MKKILGISLVALFAAMPTIAGAADIVPNIISTTKATSVEGDAGKVAAVSFVKGAYRGIASEISNNTVASDKISSTVEGASDDKLVTEKAVLTAVDTANTAMDTRVNTLETAGYITSAASNLQYYTKTADISSGTTNGTIKFGTTEVAVAGLGTAAYTDSSAYDVSGAASTAKGEIEGKFASGSTGYDINAKSLKVQNAAVLTENSALNGANLTNSTVALDKLESSVQSALEKAGTALQASDIATGTTSGTIKVGDSNVAVNGLGSAAFSGVATEIASGATGLATAQQVYNATKDKADAATSLAGYGITDAYTSTAADNKFATQSGVKASIESATYTATLAGTGVTGTITAMTEWGSNTQSSIDLQNGSVTNSTVNVSASATYKAN